MNRTLALLLSSTLAWAVAGCAAFAPPSARTAWGEDPTLGGVCKVGPDGEPLFTDRGIGGTGIVSQPVQMADRGIGGTGLRPDELNGPSRGKRVGAPTFASTFASTLAPQGAVEARATGIPRHGG